jgi:hypothetical protein
MGFLIETIVEIKNMPCTEKNGFPTYCTHDFFYWSLEKQVKFGYFQFSIISVLFSLL